MYLRTVHAEFQVPLLREFIRSNPFGLIITALESPNFPKIQCTQIPWVLDVIDESSDTKLGVLRGHMAKPNPHSKALVEAAQSSGGCLEQEVSVLFNSPTHSYVTPKFYVETKPATGKVVPTWNYSAVQAYGKAKIFFDSHGEETKAFLQKQITDLTKYCEEDIMGNTAGSAWEVSDAPPSYVDLLRKNIIGLEIEIERLEGKWKMSQELGKGDRSGVIEGFKALKTENGAKIAGTVEERGIMKDEGLSARA